MPNHKRNHEENRKCVCILCFRKPKGQLRNLSDKMRQLFINYVLTDDTNGLSDMSFSWLPTTLCVSCKKLLDTVAKNPKLALKHVDFASLTPPQVFRGEVVTRSSLEVECGCSVCEVARMDNVGFKYIKYKMGMSDPKARRPGLRLVRRVWLKLALLCIAAFAYLSMVGESHTPVIQLSGERICKS